MSLFIVFEGIDGGGKTTQARILYGLLCQRGIRAKIIHEPGGTALGDALRSFVTLPRQSPVTAFRGRLIPALASSQVVAKDLWVPLVPIAELFLFAAARAQLVEEALKPLLSKQVNVVCDRYVFSTLAYQGYGRGLDLELLKRINHEATQDLQPDLVLLLDIEPSLGLRRKRKTVEFSRFEEEELAFHQRVRKGYLTMAAADPQRWRIVDAGKPKKKVAQAIWDAVAPYLPKQQTRPSGVKRESPGEKLL